MFRNVYNYQCLTKVLYFFPSLFPFSLIYFPPLLLKIIEKHYRGNLNTELVCCILYCIEMFFEKKKIRKLTNTLLWYNNFGKNQTLLHWNGKAATPKKTMSSC